MIISGRSDSTINRGGVRIGTGEIYRAVLVDEAVVDALVVDVPREGAESWMALFVALREGESLSPEVASRIRQRAGATAHRATYPTTSSRSPGFRGR